MSFRNSKRIFYNNVSLRGPPKGDVTRNYSNCYDPSYASSLVAMLMAILRAIADRSPLEHRLVPKPTLFRVSLCSPESYR